MQSIKSIFNSVGINYDEYYKFREYGKSLNTFIEKSYLKKNKDFKIINFNQTNKNLVLKSKLNNLNNFFNEKSYTFEFFLHYINYLQQKKWMTELFTTNENEWQQRNSVQGLAWDFCFEKLRISRLS